MNGVKTVINLWEKDIPGFEPGYGQEAPSLEPYPARGDKTRGAVIVLPGGGYANKAAHEGEPVALWLNGIGISAFVLDYRVAPYRHPYPLMDAQRSVRYLRYHAKEWNIAPDRIGILGFSAGGHLASSVGMHFRDAVTDGPDPVDKMSSRPDAMILCYPVITMGEHTHGGSLQNLLGKAPDRGLVEYLSGEKQAAADTPPAFIWHTADDEAVPVENSLMLASALAKNKVSFEMHIFPHGSHGLGLAQEAEGVCDWTDMCGRWLRKAGFCGRNG